MDEHVRVVNLVFGKDVLHHFLVEVRQRLSAVQLHSSQFRGSDRDLRRTFVETDADLLQLTTDLHLMFLRLRCLQHHQNHVRVLGHSYHLFPASLSLGCTLDDAGQIEQLDLGVVVVDDSGDAGESGELVGCREGGRVCDASQQSGLSH